MYSAREGQFEAWWQCNGEWVEPPNVRRGGESGVQRLQTPDAGLVYVKRQTGHVYRSLRHPFGYPTAMRERKALLAYQQLGVAVPALVFAACRRQAGDWQALLVTEALDDYRCLEELYAAGQAERWGEALHLRILQQVGQTLGRLNRGRWQHGCLYLKHVFVRLRGEQIEIALLDLEKSRQRLSARQAARHDLRQLRRRSSWSDVQWQAVVYGYQTAYGSAIKGLQL
ncbi:MAG: lipopolysaccharide kinase InaA family protein [Pseudomonas sp.]|uniref:lipopolysaccharide kinase InaA family protein n=1 Tax=Pseudomonas sp. TaxID=306 RepID=UPI0033937324